MITIAYVYRWTHTTTKKWYIGSRTKVGCYPDDGYICSSKVVKPLIKESPNDWSREILFVGEPDKVLMEENTILTELDAKNDPNSFNMHNGDGKFSTAGISPSAVWRKNISNAIKGKTRSEEVKEHYRTANRAKAEDPVFLQKLRKPKPPGFGEKVSASTKGKKKTPEHRAAMSASKKGRSTGPCSETRKLAIQQSLKGKHTLPLVTCPYCGLIGRSNMHRWHFENCKKKPT